MVEINNQRKAFSNTGVVGELITDVRKPGNHGYDVIVGELFTDYSITLANLSPKPKTQINRRRIATSFFPVGGMPTAAAWPERLLSEKSGRCGIAAD